MSRYLIRLGVVLTEDPPILIYGGSLGVCGSARMVSTPLRAVSG